MIHDYPTIQRCVTYSLVKVYLISTIPNRRFYRGAVFFCLKVSHLPSHLHKETEENYENLHHNC